MIEFELIRQLNKKNDDETVKTFTGLVKQVYWGNLFFIDDDEVEDHKINANLGLILIEVQQSYQRSLIIKPKHIITKNKFSLPA